MLHYLPLQPDTASAFKVHTALFACDEEHDDLNIIVNPGVSHGDTLPYGNKDPRSKAKGINPLGMGDKRVPLCACACFDDHAR